MLTADRPTKLVAKRPASADKKAPNKKPPRPHEPAPDKSSSRPPELQKNTKNVPDIIHDHSFPGDKKKHTLQRNLVPTRDQPSAVCAGQTSPVSATQPADTTKPSLANTTQPSLANTTQPSLANTTQPSLANTTHLNQTRYSPPRPNETWERQILTSFRNLFNKKETSDVIILLGKERIYAHKLILDLNSKLLQSQTEAQHNIEGRLTVDLLDYTEDQETLREIVESFYTGCLVVNRDNIKVVYKFAKVHSIRWISSFSLKLFGSMIPKDFVAIFQFATKLKCEPLKDLCISNLTHPLFTSLLDCGDLWKLEPESMAVLVSTDSLNIQESDVFYLVSRWYEYDQVKRGSYISELLFYIRYHLMSKDQLVGPVYDWISAVKGLEDDTKLRLFIKINKFMKVPGLVALNNTNNDHVTADKGSSKKLSRKLTGDDETLLQLIVHSVQHNNSARCADSKQLMKVLRESFPRANPTTKQCVVEYISENQLVDSTNITSLLQTYTVTKHQNVLLLCVQYVMSSITRNIHQVMWEQLTAEVVKDMLAEINAGKQEFLIAESVMRWGDAHTSDPASVRSLLQMICYHNIPELYISRVLLPHVQKLLPDVRELTCKRHTKHSYPTRPKMANHKAPPDLYLLKSFEFVTKLHVITLDKKTPDRPLTVVNKYYNSKKKGRSPPGYLVLYDMNTTLEHYPVSVKLTLGTLRQVLEKSANLHFMLLY